MTTEIQTHPESKASDLPPIIHRAAEQWGINPEKVFDFMLATVVKGTKNYRPKHSDCAHVLMVAMQYNLNPFTKEIHAFVDRDKIIPVVGVDGWARIANSNGFDGSDVTYENDGEGKPISCTVSVHVKGRGHPVTVTEYMDECYVPPRNNYPGPWQSHPRRMLRHKAFIQACRIAFSIAGIYDEDEAERVIYHDPPKENESTAEDDVLLGEIQDAETEPQESEAV